VVLLGIAIVQELIKPKNAERLNLQ